MCSCAPIAPRDTRTSSAGERIFGQPLEALIGHHAWEFAHAVDVDRVRTALAESGDHGDWLEFEYRLRRPDSSFVWVHMSAWWDPKTDEAAGWVRDITAQKQLLEATQQFEGAFEHAPIGMALTSLDGHWLRVNRALCTMLGRSEEELCGIEFHELSHPHDYAFDASGFAALRAGECDSYEREKRYLHSDGHVVCIELTASIVRGADGQPLYLVSKMQDISRRKAQEAELREVTQRFEGAFEHAPIGMGIVTIDGRWLRVNRALCSLTGYGEAELLSRNIEDLTHPDDVDASLQALGDLLAGVEVNWECEQRYLRKDGGVVVVSLSASVVEDTQGELQHLIMQIRDVTERKRLEARLVHLADHDPLTELYNRRRFEVELDSQLRLARRYGDTAALLMLDLDHFKYVNDSLGHTVGDRVIAHVGALLPHRLRDTDVVARLGGDEFAVILPRVDPGHAAYVADTLVRQIEENPFVHAGHSYRLSASVGVSMLTAETASAEDALVTADVALYDAKQHGRNRVALFSPDRREDVLEGLTWSQRLREALATDGFELHAQPIVNLRTGETVMQELLVRMRSENGTLIAPGQFLGPAARFGYMPAIDKWVIAQAVKLLAAVPGRRLTVNLAAQTIAEARLVDYITEQIVLTGADPHDLIFELSEADLIANLDLARDTCERLQRLGCAIALDDFGSGFSGFSYLKAFSVDLLKIDGQFIREVGTNEVDRLVVRAILDVARGMKLPTVAEFVSDGAVAQHCRELGATYGQGFYLARPRPLTGKQVLQAAS